MSYYGVSVLITILVTSLVAFYLLYKAKELNLGIVISISIGSIILGITLSPAFKAVLKLLADNVNINKKVALIMSLLIVLFLFMLFILIVSFIISICIPKKLASIDCCVVIDRIISKIKIKDGSISIIAKFTGFLRKVVTNLQKIVKNVYNIINKLKKPVDTRQIIDTMEIEKSEKIILQEKSTYTIETPDSIAFANLIAFMEPSTRVANANQDNSTDEDIIGQSIEVNGSAYENLATLAYQEIVTTHISDIPTDEVCEDVFNELSEITIENQVAESEIVEIDVTESQMPESEIIEIDITESETPLIETAKAEPNQIFISDENTTAGSVIDDDLISQIECDKEIFESGSKIDASSLVLKAFESKDAGSKEDAIEFYTEALQYETNNEMLFWIVLDICALYKQLGLSELARSILDGLVSEYGDAIQPEVKMEIMNYLK